MVDVLVVDDSEFIRTMVAALCEENGWSHVEAADLAQARRAIEADPPRVAVVDYHLPDGSGIELVPFVRRHAPGVQVLGMTMQPRDHVHNRYAGAEVDIVLDKEVVLRDELVTTLQAHLVPA